jgi:hypothetical protein
MKWHTEVVRVSATNMSPSALLVDRMRFCGDSAPARAARRPQIAISMSRNAASFDLPRSMD